MKQSDIWYKNGMFILVVVSFFVRNGSSVHEMKCCDWGIIGDSIDIHIRPSLGSLCDVEFKISKVIAECPSMHMHVWLDYWKYGNCIRLLAE